MKTSNKCLPRLLLLLTLLPGTTAAADPSRAERHVTLDDVESGTLLVPAGGKPAQYIPLPGLHTDVNIEVAGVAAQVDIEQTFHNPTTSWMEAVYVFPLPENSALTRLIMRVADRVIEGVVKEKHRARKQYEKAKRTGRKAGLVTQQRPNLFTSRVANIPPGESISITLSYQETVSHHGSGYSLRVPLVAGPRYQPPSPTEPEDTPAPGADARQWANPNTIPPELGRVNPVSIRFDLDAGFALDAVTSPYHVMNIARPDERRATGTLTGRYFADRDFELRWRPAAGADPGTAVFVDQRDNEAFVLLMLQPPLRDVERPTSPRELILIIDASGSMHGESIQQALSAARFALSTLGQGDRFNLIRFANSASMLFPSPQPAGPAALAQAERFLARIDADGGTNMAAALRRAFANPVGEAAVRQLVFLTDGAVGNEAELFALIHDGTRKTRLFPVGIGSAPNGYFMRRAARVGRGTYTYIGRSTEVATKMTALFERIRRPALTDIRLDWQGAEVLAAPERVPDLYHGEPLVLTARVAAFDGVTLRGRYAGRPWSHTVEAESSRGAPWVSTAWARQRIKRLKDELLGGGDRAAVKSAITRIGLAHQLVTPYTSLVAIERRVSRPEDASAFSADAPVNLPKGWSYRHVFGSLPQTGLGWRRDVAVGLMLLSVALVLLWRCRTSRPSPG